MSGSYLLDTNIAIALIEGDTNVNGRLNAADEVYVPVIVVGELYYGARYSGRVARNLRRIDEFVRANSILVCDVETAQHFGLIRSNLRKKGRPIPENDIWIAAVVLQHNLTLTTRDAHFSSVDNLVVEAW